MAATPPRPLPSALYVEKGTCHVLFAYEVAQSIDVDEAQRHLTSTQRATIKHKRRAPRYFDYRPAPLRVTQGAESVRVAGYETRSQVDTVLYDFGAVSVSYSIPLRAPLSHLIRLSDELNEHAILFGDSRRRVEELLAALGPAVTRPQIADFVEQYTIIQIEEFNRPCRPDELWTTEAQALAQILRSEQETLSSQEVSDALAYRICFGPADVTIIDWDASVVFDRDPEDVLAVLEFANVELLEMRYLDQQLDDALDQAYKALSRRNWRRATPGASHADLQLVAQLQVDAAVLFEGVNNTLKLLGDQYLARVYRLASQRFHLSEWDASILRKLETLNSIYAKMSDLAASRRMEILEWIIIVLIAVSIVIPFLPGLSAK